MIFTISFLLFLGGLIIGIYLIRFGHLNLLDDSFDNWITHLTDTPWKCLAIGVFMTSVLQDSAMVTVITLSFVAARYLTFSHSIGIILGTNMATILPIENLTINLEAIFPIALFGAILCFVQNRYVISTGYSLIGLAVILGAMWGVETIAAPLLTEKWISPSILALEQFTFYGILFGAITTLLTRSYVPLIGITIGLLSAGFIDLGTGIPIMIGGYLGIYIVTRLRNRQSIEKRPLSAEAYTFLNLLAVSLFHPLLNFLVMTGLHLSPYLNIERTYTPFIVYTVVSLFLLPFVNYFEYFFQRLHKRINKKSPS